MDEKTFERSKPTESRGPDEAAASENQRQAVAEDIAVLVVRECRRRRDAKEHASDAKAFATARSRQ